VPQALREALRAQRSGRTVEAAQAYRRVLDVDPSNFDTSHMLGLVGYENSRYDQAMALLKQAIELRPELGTPPHNLRLLESMPVIELEICREVLPRLVARVDTGFADLDRMTSGLQEGDLIVIAGRPSMGKTSLALNIGEHIALSAKLPVAIFSMEMGAMQFAMRLIGSVGRLDQHKVRTGRLTPDDWERLSEALGRLSDAAIHVGETPALNALELRARAPARATIRRQARRDHRRLSAAHAGGWRRRESGDGNLRNLALAQGAREELKVPVIALSQLNRSLEQRPNKRPIMSDLRESGAIAGQRRDPVHLSRRGLQ
jgi:replicative DNA helicase